MTCEHLKGGGAKGDGQGAEKEEGWRRHFSNIQDDNVAELPTSSPPQKSGSGPRGDEGVCRKDKGGMGGGEKEEEE